ncbi:hypothetical protein DdX_06366 [Ditylenchus destructor]|uniref:Uncharacterized protein n=1 Tax=Ditylenchus destructor TaxID=166010 RepID=A0AAD4N4I3_9BILA|nr:hypothetical protein DdX_06366 [Ditylenchus destructor]
MKKCPALEKRNKTVQASLSEDLNHQRRHHSQYESERNDITAFDAAVIKNPKSASTDNEGLLSFDYGIGLSQEITGKKTELAISAVGGRSGEQVIETGNINEELPNAIAMGDDFLGVWKFIKENKEQSLLYFFLSISVGIILLLIACIAYQCRARSKEKQAMLSSRHKCQTVSMCGSTTRLPPDNKSGAELSSLIGSSNHTSPLYLDSDDSPTIGLGFVANPPIGEYAGVIGIPYSNCGTHSTGTIRQPIYSAGEASSGSSGHSQSSLYNSRSIRSAHIRSNTNMMQQSGQASPWQGHYTRFSQVTPPRIPFHYCS